MALDGLYDPQDDPVYAGATCDEDADYQGSEDEDYSDSQMRRRRYEEAGQRFLDGKIPFLLSASLRGPFDEKSGWSNPWRSKQRCESGRASQFICESVQKKTTKIPQKQEPIAHDLECHLPSPESLKQAPASGAHPYLEQDELAMVQNWREAIHVPSLSQDSFWASSNSPARVSTKKRRANESAWLKRVADKRRKTDAGGPAFSSSPLALNQIDSYSSPVVRIRATIASTARASSRSPGHGIGSTQKSPSAHPSQLKPKDNRDDDDDDELMTNTPGATSASASRRYTRCRKHSSPRLDVRRSAVLHVSSAPDELGRKEAAAATISSPISQRYGTSPTCASQATEEEVLKSFAAVKTSPTKRGQLDTNEEAQYECSVMDIVGERDIEPTMALDRDPALFQTQQDQSFYFKKRFALESGVQELSDEPDQPTSPPKLVRQKSLSAVEGTPPQMVDEKGPIHDEGDARDDDETESVPASDDSYEHQVQPREQCLSEANQELLACHANSQVDQQGVCEGAEEGMAEIARQAVHVVSPLQSPLQSGLGCSSPAIKPKKKPPSLSQPLPLVTSLASQSGCHEAAPGHGSVEIRPPTELNEATTVTDLEHETPISAALPQANSVDATLEVEISSRPSMALEEAEVVPCVEAQCGLQDAVVPAENDSSPMREKPSPSAEGTRRDFSIKSMLDKLAPLSPWSRPSQPAPDPTPSPVSQPRMDAVMDETPYETRPEEADAGPSDSSQRGVSEPKYFGPSVSAPEETQEAALPNVVAETAALDAVPEQGRITDGKGADGGMKANSTDPDETLDETWIVASQQSPWARAEPSQRQRQPVGGTPPSHKRQKSPADSSQPVSASQVKLPPEVQSPWSRDAEMAANTAARSGAAADADGCGSHDGHVSKAHPHPRPLTPEPQFAVTTFASFLSPSPERSRGQRGHLPFCVGEGGGPRSAMKKPWSCSRPERRVSWVSMLQDREVDHDEQKASPPGPTANPSPRRHRLRQLSPPPATPIQDLPVSEQSRFGKHFAAVAGRTDDLRQTLIPTASQQARQSPGMQGMALTFMAADEVGPGDRAAAAATDDAAQAGGGSPHADQVEADGGSDGSEEPMELVDDMLREIADFVKAWDVDAELDEARRAAGPGMSRLDVASQSPW